MLVESISWMLNVVYLLFKFFLKVSINVLNIFWFFIFIFFSILENMCFFIWINMVRVCLLFVVSEIIWLCLLVLYCIFCIKLFFDNFLIKWFIWVLFLFKYVVNFCFVYFFNWLIIFSVFSCIGGNINDVFLIFNKIVLCIVLSRLNKVLLNFIGEIVVLVDIVNFFLFF